MTKKRTAKRSFIWFGSPGAIHKGLDILIDVFKILTDFDLFVCGANKQELKELYNGERQNIHLIDFVDIASIGFLELLKEVTWVISPSCSEACSTSILTCMRHGLIPVITKACAIDIDKTFGFYLSDYSVEYIVSVLLNLSTISDAEIIQLSQNAELYSTSISSRESYFNSLSDFFENILLEKKICYRLSE